MMLEEIGVYKNDVACTTVVQSSSVMGARLSGKTENVYTIYSDL